MALNPNERLPGPATVYDDLSKVPSIVKLPPGVERTKGVNKDWYVQSYTTRDGRTFYEVYKRGGKPALPNGTYPPDDVFTTVEGPLNQDQAERFKKEQADEAKGAPTVTLGGVPHSVTGKDEQGRDIYAPVQTQPGAAAAAAQTPAQQNEAALNAQRQKNAAWPADQDPRYETDQERAARSDARIKEQGAAAAKAEAEAKAEREKRAPQVIPSTINTTSPHMGTLVTAPDGTQTVQWVPNPNYRNPDPKPIPMPPSQQWVVWDNGDGTTRTEKNPNWEKPSKIQKNERTGRWEEITVDDNGKPVVLPVNDQTTIKPADLPVLQSKYGEIASGLGALAQDLNGRVARQEITPEERKEAFTAAYQQAQTQVSELNSILDNSKAIWSGQVTQRGQTLSETQSRRSFASDAAGRAITTGYNIATSAGPGHGKAIARGVEALMGMQQQYAQGMGGFRESPEIGLPPALEQARGIGLPGFPMPGGAGAAAPTAGPVGAAAPAPAGPPAGPGISNTTDAGGAPRVYTPASSTVGSGLPPQGPSRMGIEPEPLARPGGGRIEPEPLAPGGPPLAPGDPRLQLEGMGTALQGAQGFAGAPVAAGGAGMWDPMLAVRGMVGDGSDPAWEQAVRRAAAGFRGQG